MRMSKCKMNVCILRDSERLAKRMIKEAILVNADNFDINFEMEHKDIGCWKFKAQIEKELK